MTASPARLLVAAEYALFRAAMRAALELDGDLRIIAEAEDGQAAYAAATRLPPHLVLLETSLPPDGGFSVCSAIKAAMPSTAVFMLAPEPDPAALLAAVEAGADGFAPAELPLAELVRAVRQVLAGEAFVPSSMLTALLNGLVRRNREADRFLQLSLRLTRREREVLELLVEGCDHEAVAEILVISPQTARTHIQNIIGKLGAHSRLEAVALTVEHRLLERSERVRRHAPAARLHTRRSL